mgnify:CR=1 FL=1
MLGVGVDVGGGRIIEKISGNNDRGGGGGGGVVVRASDTPSIATDHV